MSDTERTVLIRNWHHCAAYVWMVLFKIHLMMFLCRTLNGRYWYGTDTTVPDMCEWFYLKHIWWCFYVGHWTDGTVRYWHHCAGYVWMILFKTHLMMFLCRTLNGRYWYGTDTTAPDMCEWFYLKHIWWCFYVGQWTDGTDTELTRHW
jgi:hypothetical protein